MTIHIPPDGIPRVAPSDMDGKLAAFLRRREQKRQTRAELDRARQAGLAIRAAQKLRHVRISGRKK